MSSNVVTELAYLFRANHQSRPVLLLGAGASYRSGIPVAADAVNVIARAAYARQRKGVNYRHCQLTPSDWMPFLQQQEWFIKDPKRFAENFPLAVENLLNPREFRRQIFADLIQAPNGVNEGYKHLAQIMMRRLCWTVLTTNFDHLLADALKECRPHIHEIIQINQTDGDRVRFQLNNRCQIVYLHGAVEYYRDSNLVQETRELDENIVRLIRPLFNESPLIVIGYRGAEGSVIEHLLLQGAKESCNYRHGIYWCLKQGDEPHENVLRLQRLIGTNFRLFEIQGFDELLKALDSELKDECFLSTADFPPPLSVGLKSSGTLFDMEPMDGVSSTELDHDLVLSTLTTYCARLNLPAPTAQSATAFLREHGFLVPDGKGNFVPSKGGYLLFGHNVEKHFPYASVAITRDGKRRIVFQGNLVTQLQHLLDALTSSEVNPILRVKGERTAEEKPAYPPRAIVELLVNMLVHRDYLAPEHGHIDLISDELIRFMNPGGLLPAVLTGVDVQSDGTFQPRRRVSELRNPLLADIFYGLGPMDKEGTGLIDVRAMMLEHGGMAEFAVLENNHKVSAVLKQPRPSEPRSRAARRLSPVEVFTTNLLPFKVFPNAVYSLQLREAYRPGGSALFLPDDNLARLPLVIRHGTELISFSDLSKFPEFAHRVGNVRTLTRMVVAEFVANTDRRRLLVWLLGKHWEFFIRQRASAGLIVVPLKKRAYFGTVGGSPNVIRYQSRGGRMVRREVVKPRGEANGRARWHENEGIFYSIENVGDEWAVQLKPFYTFTGLDGATPLPAFRQTRLATRRMKFDRNPNVDDDLTFWARFLSNSEPVMNLGGQHVDDMILDSEYTCVEIPVSSKASSEN